MNRKLIPTQKFVKNFPMRVKELANRYAISSIPKISYRTFRYYITNKLMPKPKIINNKSYYNSSFDVYERLFLIWYLIHFSRATIGQIRSLFDYLQTQERLDCIKLFLDDIRFMEKVFDRIYKKQSLMNKDLIYLHQEYTTYGLEEGREAVFKILEYLIKIDTRELKDIFKKVLKEKRSIIKSRNYYKERLHTACRPEGMFDCFKFNIPYYKYFKYEIDSMIKYSEKSQKMIEGLLNDYSEMEKMIMRMRKRPYR